MAGSKKNATWAFIKKHMLLELIILAMIVGIALGAGLRYLDPPLTKREQMYLKYPGELLMRMLKLLILPLIVTSLISGLATLDAKASGKLGGRAILYYMSTTLMAVVLGIILVVAIRPGGDSSKKDVDREGTAKLVHPADAFLDLIRNMFPPNVVESCFKQTLTTYTITAPDVSCCKCCDGGDGNKTGGIAAPMMNTTNLTTVAPVVAATKPNYDNFKIRTKDGMNVLGLVVFSIVFGVIISRLEPKTGQPLITFFVSFNEAVMKMVALVIWYSPIGILFLIAERIVYMEDVAKVVQQLGMYTVTVLAGLAIHGFIVLPLLFFILTRKNPFSFMLGVLQALVTAVGTASSSATLPVTFRCLEENNGVDKRVTRFVLPVGATINMDGTALYEAVAAIFIAQLNNIDLDFGQIIAVSITATAASIGAAGVPQAGLVTMAIVLTAVGLPLEDVTLIIAVDWFLDRFRTMINVLGDSFGAGIVEHYSKNDLEKMRAWDDESVHLEFKHRDDEFPKGNANAGYEPDMVDNTKM